VSGGAHEAHRRTPHLFLSEDQQDDQEGSLQLQVKDGCTVLIGSAMPALQKQIQLEINPIKTNNCK